MSDQSLDQVNGRSLVAAFAICEQRLNTVMVLRESAEIGGGRVRWGSPMHRVLHSRQGHRKTKTVRLFF
jgi:hypothetical protein